MDNIPLQINNKMEETYKDYLDEKDENNRFKFVTLFEIMELISIQLERINDNLIEINKKMDK